MAIDPWARIDETTINKHIERYTQPIFVQHYLLAGLKEKKRILLNQSGKKFDWRVQFRQGSPYDIDDMQARNPQRTNFWQTAELPYRGAGQEEAVSKFEKLANKGTTEGLIKIVAEMVPILTKSMNDYFAEQLFVDGTTAANAKKIHGLNSFSSAAANNKAASPNQTNYAGLNCTLANYGGTWTAPTGEAWPYGTGDREYEFWSPRVWDYTNAAWSGSPDDWANNYREVLEVAVVQAMLRKITPDVILLSPDLYLTMLNQIGANEQIQITRADAGSMAIRLGFKALSFMGIDIVTEYSAPATQGFMFRFDDLTLRSMQGQMFVFERDHDWQMRSDLIGVDFYGNLQVSSPRAFDIFDDIT